MTRPDQDALEAAVRALWAMVRPELRRLTIEAVTEAQRSRTWSTAEVARYYGMSVPALRQRLDADPSMWRCITPLPIRGSRKRPRLRWHMDRLERYLAEMSAEQRKQMGWK